MSARERLAKAQAELARALGMGAPVPAGFDAERVGAAAEALGRKRRRLVQRTWPVLAAALGGGFAGSFDAWARENPLLGVEPNPLADGRRFAGSLRAAGAFPAEAEEEWLAFELRWRLTDEGGVVARRGVVLKLARVGRAGRRVLAARLPGGRILQWRLPGRDP
ncbi:hypothetical protein NR798_00530 [Archangium gephyra]|uniref:hypothetical protein n=1 Tax=Archangium gephyra TaxID=48 RepID=UPI0035D48AFE